MRRLALAGLLALSCTAHAVVRPQPCGGDLRVRCVKYDPKEVVAVTAMFGYQTFVYFSPEERLTDLGGGDTDAWTIGAIEGANGIFIKPKGHKPATNITIVTSINGKQRIYNFDFNVAELKEAEKRTYMVWFQYPEEEAKKRAAAEKSNEPSVAMTLKYASAKKTKNEDYWFDGSTELAPTAAWDDGEFTYLRFAPNVPFPAVYIVNPDGTESLLNKHVPERNTIAVQAIGRKFVLRRGDIFTCIFNESYDAYGVETDTKTSSPRVVRKLKEGEPQETAKPARTVVPSPQPGVLPPGAATPTVVPAQQPAAAAGPLPTVDLSSFVPESAQRPTQGGK
jgi:type IV secretion system protein VirB9